MKDFSDKQYYQDNRLLLVFSLLQRSDISSGAYDTAWLARLAIRYPDSGFGVGIDWLRANQHADGSWGSIVFHYHDRIVCTLVSFLALSELGDNQDVERLSKAKRFIEDAVGELHLDLMDTIGFPLIFARLVYDVRPYGLVIDEALIPFEKIEQKLSNVPLLEYVHEQSLFYSFEALSKYYPAKQLDQVNDGCVGASPAATIGAILDNLIPIQSSLDYISELIEHQGDDGLPVVDFADTFEITWVLNNLRYGGLIQRNDEDVRVILEYLSSIWESRSGDISFSTKFKMADLDETAVAYTLLQWAGYPVGDKVFEQFEGENYFYCYPNELDPSLSANIRFLVALQYIKHPQKVAWQSKVIDAINNWSENDYWFDKWHVSPYYLTASSIWMLMGIEGVEVAPKIDWILSTQHSDGGWGYYGTSTVEETAYCVQALSAWLGHYDIDTSPIKRGRDFLLTHSHDDLPAMWVGKCLYTPHKVVGSSILSALHISSNI